MVLPYLALGAFAGGMVWRYRYDRLGWTTRSSQLFEQGLLRWGSPLFHLGMLLTVGGHVVGILVPEGWTTAAGLPTGAYHAMAVTLGVLAGGAAVLGLAILLYRRVTVPAVRQATTGNDKVMYVALAATLLLGMAATTFGTGHDYRQSVSPWFRSIVLFDPDGQLMADAPLLFQLHALSAWALLAYWPFTRLVHFFSAPVGYLTRPYVVYRSR